MQELNKTLATTLIREPCLKPTRDNAKKTETESVKTEQPVKTNFFEVLPLLKSEKLKLMKDAYISEEDA